MEITFLPFFRASEAVNSRYAKVFAQHAYAGMAGTGIK